VTQFDWCELIRKTTRADLDVAMKRAQTTVDEQMAKVQRMLTQLERRDVTIKELDARIAAITKDADKRVDVVLHDEVGVYVVAIGN
jgi:signal transduction histidine kinase